MARIPRWPQDLQSLLMPPIQLSPVLLARDEFRAAVLKRDGGRCVLCGRQSAEGEGTLDAHHLLNRRLWAEPHEEGGYFVSNGATLCPGHHLDAEYTRSSVEAIRIAAGIREIVLPAQLTPDEMYDTWGNVVLLNGTRLRGPLFDSEACQKALAAGGVLADFTHFVKGHRIVHLPWSEGAGDDDIVDASVEHFAGREVTVTLKLDGENATLYRDYIHARSLGAMSHPSQSKVKAFHATIAHEIPERWRVCVENCAAEHTYGYDDLDSLFPVTAVFDERNVRLAWNDMVEVAGMIGLPTAPVLGDALLSPKH